MGWGGGEFIKRAAIARERWRWFFLLQMVEDLGALSKARLKPSFGEDFKNSKNSPEKGVPLSSRQSDLCGVEKRGTPFSGEFWEFLEPSPKEGSKQGLGQRPKVFKKKSPTFSGALGWRGMIGVQKGKEG